MVNNVAGKLLKEGGLVSGAFETAAGAAKSLLHVHEHAEHGAAHGAEHGGGEHVEKKHGH
jgi:hypothetical protein